MLTHQSYQSVTHWTAHFISPTESLERISVCQGPDTVEQAYRWGQHLRGPDGWLRRLKFPHRCRTRAGRESWCEVALSWGMFSFVFFVQLGSWWRPRRAGQVYSFARVFQLVFRSVAKSVKCPPMGSAQSGPKQLSCGTILSGTNIP